MNEMLIFARTPPASPWPYVLFGIAMFATAIFLILLVLVQRGRGGGLAGAFGGMGGQSAFGAKAGDTFTKVTIYASTFWILLCMAALAVLNPKPESDAAPAPGIHSPGGAGATLDGSSEGATDEDDSEADSTAADGAADGNTDGGTDQGGASTDGSSADSESSSTDGESNE